MDKPKRIRKTVMLDIDTQLYYKLTGMQDGRMSLLRGVRIVYDRRMDWQLTQIAAMTPAAKSSVDLIKATLVLPSDMWERFEYIGDGDVSRGLRAVAHAEMIRKKYLDSTIG